MHAGLLLAFAPERDRDVADPHRLGDAGAPGGLELGARSAGSPPPGSPATSRRRTADPARSNPLALGAFGKMEREGRREGDVLRREAADCGEYALGVAGAERDVAEPEPARTRRASTPATKGPAL